MGPWGLHRLPAPRQPLTGDVDLVVARPDQRPVRSGVEALGQSLGRWVVFQVDVGISSPFGVRLLGRLDQDAGMRSANGAVIYNELALAAPAHLEEDRVREKLRAGEMRGFWTKKAWG